MKRLTEFGQSAGAGCKIAPGELAQLLRRLTPSDDPNLLVGLQAGDDSAVYRLDTDRALVVRADFFTPVVDDARTWGQIVATHSVSGIYAMGGRPLLALNLVAWNTEELSGDLLAEVLLGGQDVAEANGFIVVGGHSIDDPEPKYGLAVIGEAHSGRLLTNAGLRDGDVLILTKSLGTGIVTEQVKAQTVAATLAAQATRSMLVLNAEPAKIALRVDATGCTAIGGFGLLGHLGRLALESGVDIELGVESVPLFEGIRELANTGVVTNAAHRNLSWVRSQLDAGSTSEVDQLLLSDPQTSGGLVFGVQPDKAEQAVVELADAGHTGVIIGRAVFGAGTIHLR
ncbi:MAG: selenide, water dikinase SelD [Acidimicrobiales bacterium]